VSLSFASILISIKWILVSFIPWYPLIILMGILPQADTCVMTVVEQLNIHLFGGSGSTSLAACLIDFGVSLVIVLISFWPGWVSGPQNNFLFSLYLGIIIGLSLLQSRLPKDFSAVEFQWTRSKSKSNLTTVTLPSLILEFVVAVIVIFIFTGLYVSTLFDRFGIAGENLTRVF